MSRFKITSLRCGTYIQGELITGVFQKEETHRYPQANSTAQPTSIVRKPGFEWIQNETILASEFWEGRDRSTVREGLCSGEGGMYA